MQDHRFIQGHECLTKFHGNSSDNIYFTQKHKHLPHGGARREEHHKDSSSGYHDCLYQMPIHLMYVEIFYRIDGNIDLLVVLVEKSGITRVLRIYPVGIMNV